MSFGFTDKVLTCRDCGTQFVFTAGEQQFYADKGFTNEPSRCPTCRQAARARRSGRGDAPAYRSREPREARQDRPMYPAICSDCGRETMVPFLPRQDRPVYCSDCFRARRMVSSGY
jgi:CxxC-x17-CxxC domain-containing protein